jgi:hypothetical protein
MKKSPLSLVRGRKHAALTISTGLRKVAFTSHGVISHIEWNNGDLLQVSSLNLPDHNVPCYLSRLNKSNLPESEEKGRTALIDLTVINGGSLDHNDHLTMCLSSFVDHCLRVRFEMLMGVIHNLRVIIIFIHQSTRAPLPLMG